MLQGQRCMTSVQLGTGMLRQVISLILACCFLFLPIGPVFAAEDTLKLRDLLREAIKHNPEIQALEARTRAAEHRIPQAKSLADPMFMVGYENEGTSNLYTFNRDMPGKDGEPADSRWMFSLSQMFPFPGKLALKGDMATRDAESQQAMIEAVRLNTIVRVKELFYDLSLAYANIDLFKDKTALFSRTEEAALARYTTGMAPQQEVLMAQTEKYMLLEREEMERQKIKSLEAMLNALLGRDGRLPLGNRPETLPYVPYAYQAEQLVNMSYEKNPLIKSREKMVAAAEFKVQMAKKEFYPDFTVGGTYFSRHDDLPDMWNVTATINIPLYYKKKQQEAVLEAEASLREAKREVEMAKLMASSTVRDNYAMVKTADKLLTLYKEGLIPKTYQDVEAALTGYSTGKVEAITVISRLKALLDYELLYRGQFAQREKAAARIEGVAGITDDKDLVK